MRITWPGRILLLGILVAIGWSWVDGRARDARVDELASQPACSLAFDYWSWHLSFFSALPPETTVLVGDTLSEFVKESQLFRDAIERHENSNQLPLRTLLTAVIHDSNRDEDEVADYEIPTRDFIRACPDEATTLRNRF